MLGDKLRGGWLRLPFVSVTRHVAPADPLGRRGRFCSSLLPPTQLAGEPETFLEGREGRGSGQVLRARARWSEEQSEP